MSENKQAVFPVSDRKPSWSNEGWHWQWP